MAAGFRGLLAFWAGGAAQGLAPTVQAGVRGMLAPWIGGAGKGSAPPVATPGFRGLLGFWIGGAGRGGSVVTTYKPGWRKFEREYETNEERAARETKLRAKKDELFKGIPAEEYLAKAPADTVTQLVLENLLKQLLQLKGGAELRKEVAANFGTLHPLLLDLPRVQKGKDFRIPAKLARQLELERTKVETLKMKRIAKMLQDQEEEEIFLMMTM